MSSWQAGSSQGNISSVEKCYDLEYFVSSFERILIVCVSYRILRAASVLLSGLACRFVDQRIATLWAAQGGFSGGIELKELFADH